LEIDKTYVFYNLGKAYVGLSDYVSATVCLLEAAKYDGQISEEVVFALLQQVEFLQREAASQRQNSSHVISSSSDESGSGSGLGSSYGTAITSSDGAETPVAADITLPLALRRNRKDLTPITSELSLVSHGDETEDEGTAYYDSESPSVYDPVFRSDISSSLFESDMVLNSDALLASDALHFPNRDRVPTDVPPSESELEGAQIDIPDADGSVQLLEVGEDGPSLPSLRGTADAESRTFSGFRLRLGSSRARIEPKQTGESAAPGSQRSSLAKTLTGKFRRQRRGGSGFRSDSAIDPLENSLKTPSEEGEKTPPSSSLPSEEDYHSTLEGPVQYVTIRSESFDSCISQITLRFDDPNRPKETSHEWWWNVTAEGIARWFPTSYVSKAVEAAEGFLSAQSIHSKVRSTPLEYVSDEEDSMEGKESSGGEVVDHPSYVGVTGADSKTLLSGVEGRARAKLAEARRQAAMVKSPRSDCAVSVYSGHPKRSARHVEAEIVRFSNLLESQRAKLGKAHPDIATSLFTLAVLYSRKGASAPAIEHAAEALGIQKLVGKLDDVSRSLHFLADIYLHQRQYSTALNYYTEALRIERAHYGELSDEAAMALNCIGTVHSLQNEFLSAMQSHQEALRILYVVHDEDIKHPLITETLIAVGSVYYRERNSFSKTQGITEEQYTTFVETGMLETIGRAHEDRGSYKLAISFFEEKLQLMEHQGLIQNEDELEEVATTLNSLGMLSSRAGFYVEAIDYYEKALKIQLKVGCDKVQIATARVLTGSVHFQLGDWQKALKLHQEALTVLRKELGTEHQTFAATLYQLGVVQAALCEYDAAMSLLKQALGIQARILGDDQPATLRTRREIANLYALYPSSCGLALEQLDDVLACQRLIHGDRHPNVAETLHSIGRAYARAGDVSSALQILEECYYMRTEFLGWDHPQQASTLHEICQLHLKRGRIKKALHIIDVVLGILRESLSDDHIDVALALATKASCLLEHGNIEGAKKTMKEALTIAETTVGPKHPAVAYVCVQMASVQMRQCQFEDARKVLLRSIEIYKGSDVSEEYPGMLDALEKLERVERDEMLCV
jgi:tetratricopeptide (TPR) repeat protein